MAYISPSIKATGDAITAAIWNQDVRLNWVDGYEPHIHDGSTGNGSASLGALVRADFLDAAAPAAPGAGKTRLYAVAGLPRFRAGAAGADTPLLVGGTAWRVIYLDSAGAQALLALGAAGTNLTSGGAAAAPTWTALPAASWTHRLLLMGA